MHCSLLLEYLICTSGNFVCTPLIKSMSLDIQFFTAYLFWLRIAMVEIELKILQVLHCISYTTFREFCSISVFRLLAATLLTDYPFMVHEIFTSAVVIQYFGQLMCIFNTDVSRLFSTHILRLSLWLITVFHLVSYITNSSWNRARNRLNVDFYIRYIGNYAVLPCLGYHCD
jgi:hypothetical protein